MKRYTPRQIHRTLSKYTLKENGVEVGPCCALRIIEVEDTYALLDEIIEKEGRLHRVERFPYWAELWPASLAMARWFCETEPEPPGRDARELGCGLGLVGVALARLGWRVEATDFVEDALIFATHNAQRNRVSSRHRVAYLDWSRPVGDPCACMVAADVVYEKENHPHLMRVLRKLLLPGGRFYLGDPQRPTARPFVAALEEKGYEHRTDFRSIRWKALEHKVDIHVFTKPTD